MEDLIKIEPDGNCAFNAFAILLVEGWLSNKLTEVARKRIKDRFKDMIKKENSQIEALDLDKRFSRYFNQMLGNSSSFVTLQNNLSRLLREEVVELLRNNKVRHIGNLWISFLPALREKFYKFYGVKIKENFLGDDIFLDIDAFNVYMENLIGSMKNSSISTDKLFIDDFIDNQFVEIYKWFDSTGYKEYLNHLKNPTSFMKKFVGDIELNELALAYEIKIEIKNDLISLQALGNTQNNENWPNFSLKSQGAHYDSYCPYIRENFPNLQKKSLVANQKSMKSKKINSPLIEKIFEKPFNHRAYEKVYLWLKINHKENLIEKNKSNYKKDVYYNNGELFALSIDEGFDELAEILASWGVINELVLNNVNFNNKKLDICTKLFSKYPNFLKGELVISKCKFDINIKNLEVFFQAINNRYITAIKIYLTFFYDENLMCVMENIFNINKSLTKISLHKIAFTARAYIHMCNKLLKNRNIRFLSLGNLSKIPEEAFKGLCNFIYDKNNKVRSLSIENITTLQVELLLEAVKINNTILQLVIRRCDSKKPNEKILNYINEFCFRNIGLFFELIKKCTLKEMCDDISIDVLKLDIYSGQNQNILHYLRDQDVVKYVLNHLPNKILYELINRTDDNDSTPLNYLLHDINEKKLNINIVLPILNLKENVNINIVDDIIDVNGGHAPIHYVLLNNSSERKTIFEVLLNHEYFNSNIQNRAGKTPLHVAIEHERMDEIKLLLDIPSIKIDVPDKNGKNAYEIAKEKRNNDILQILVSHFSYYQLLEKKQPQILEKNAYDPFKWMATLDLEYTSKNPSKPYKKIKIEGDQLHWKWQMLEYKENKKELSKRIKEIMAILPSFDLNGRDLSLKDKFKLLFLTRIHEEFLNFRLKLDECDSLIQLRMCIKKFKDSMDKEFKICEKFCNSYDFEIELIDNFKNSFEKAFNKIYKKTKKGKEEYNNTNYVLASLSFVVSDRAHESNGEHAYKVISLPIQIQNHGYYDIQKSKQNYDEDDDINVEKKDDFYNFFYERIISRFENMNNAASKKDKSIFKLQTVKSAKDRLSTNFSASDFHHSESLLFFYMETLDFDKIIDDLEKDGLIKNGKVYAIVLDQLSTHYTCKNCTAQTLGVQNSHSEGFLKSLTDALLRRHYKVPKNPQGIRMITRVSAEIEFKQSQVPLVRHSSEIKNIKNLDSFDIIARDNSHEHFKRNSHYTFFVSGSSSTANDKLSRRMSSSFGKN